MTPFNKFFKLIMFLTPKKYKSSLGYYVFLRFLQHPIIFIRHIGGAFRDVYYELPTILAEKREKK